MDRLGPYLIRSRLGAGGMGEVHLAWHEPLERLVALKLIRGDRAGDPAWRERLMLEARAVAKLAHPSIVGIHDVFETGHGPCVVMEFVPGRTLAQAIREAGRLSAAEALALGRDVAEGLAAAHARGLVHRDLKSDNVMVRPGGRAVILDFGLAQTRQDAAAAGAAERVAGTPHTLAPEQLDGRADERSDLFALGVLLYEMLAGSSPFRGATWQESLHQVRTLEPPPLALLRPELPAGLSPLVERLMAKEPARRPGSAAEVAATLAALAPLARDEKEGAYSDGDEAPTVSFLGSPNGTPAGSPAATPVTSPPVARERRLDPVAGLLALLLLLGGAAAFRFWKVQAGPEKAIRRVLVLPPRLGAEVPDGKLLASALLSTSLAEVGAMPGLAAVDPSLLEGAAGNPVAAARAAAAEEALLCEIEAERSGNIRVALRRIDRSGRSLFSTSLEVPRRPVDLRWAAEAWAVALASAFRAGEGGGGPDGGALAIEGADYAAFVAVLSATLDDGFATSERLAALQPLALRAPSFLPLQQLLGQMALRRYGDSREPKDLELGLATAAHCLALAPENPQAIKLAFEAALAAGREVEAEQLLGRLAKLGGEGVLALHGRARLADRGGRPEEALELARRLVALEPSWQNLLQLADREVRLGRIAEARGHLGEVLGLLPENARARTRLAELELLYGDVAAAERLFAALIAERPRRSLLNNRGLALFLAGRLDEARESFLAALELAPGHPAVALNLADLEAARGETAAAASLYRQVARRLAEQRGKAPLSPADSMILAQCLVHLGEHREAVALAQALPLEERGNGELAFQAAIVYSAAGDRTSALVAAEKALAGGVQPRFFDLPVAARLRADPALAGRLAS